jgi:hypothetical protein
MEYTFSKADLDHALQRLVNKGCDLSGGLAAGRREQAAEIAYWDGLPTADDHSASHFASFMGAYNPEEVLIFVLGSEVIRTLGRKKLGKRAISGALQQPLWAKRIIENLLFVDARKLLEKERLPDTVTSDDVRAFLRGWRAQRRNLPDLKGLKSDRGISTVLHELDEKLGAVARKQAEHLQVTQDLIAQIRADAADSLQSVQRDLRELMDTMEAHDRLAEVQWKTFEKALGELGPLGIEERVLKMRAAEHYTDLKRESLELLAASELLREKISVADYLGPLDLSFLAIGLWKAAEIELKDKIFSVLTKLNIQSFCSTKARRGGKAKTLCFAVAQGSKGIPFNEVTIGNISTAILDSNRTHAEKKKSQAGWQAPNHYLDLERFHSQWRSDEITRVLRELPRIRNEHAHTAKMDAAEYEGLRHLVDQILVPKLRHLGKTSEEERKQNDELANQEDERSRKENELLPSTNKVF